MHFHIKETPELPTPALQSELALKVLGKILKDIYGISELPEIIRLETGKPVFRMGCSLHFSISHCRSAVMVAVDEKPIGCDIEDIPERIEPGLPEVAFSEKERLQIMESKNPGKTLAKLWTMKEAQVKRLGCIPDEPREWPSECVDGGKLIVECPNEKSYVYSISIKS